MVKGFYRKRASKRFASAFCQLGCLYYVFFSRSHTICKPIKAKEQYVEICNLFLNQALKMGGCSNRSGSNVYLT